MGRETLDNGKRHLHVENGNGASAEQSKARVTPGDVFWIRLRGTSWWPVQVVDEKTVSDSFKPRKGNNGEVLVRLYGTYEYAYVDAITSKLEFDNVLKRHKGNHREIIQKGLKQDLSISQSGRSKRSSKGKVKNVSVEEKATPIKGENGKQAGDKKKPRPNSQSPDKTPQVFGGSARRFKVMQGLGLTAPSGSPFSRNGDTFSIMY